MIKQLSFYKLYSLVLILLIGLSANKVYAQYYSVQDGDWNDPATWWGGTAPPTIGSNATFYIMHDVNFNTMPPVYDFSGILMIFPDASLNGNLVSVTFSAGSTISNDGDLELNTISITNGTIDFTGNITLSNNLTINNNSTVEIEGSLKARNVSIAYKSTLSLSGVVDISGSLSNNSGETISMTSSSVVTVEGAVNNTDGNIRVDGDLIVKDEIENSSGSLIRGNGDIIVDNIYNAGDFEGTLDICGLGGATPPTVSGSGTIGNGITFCNALPTPVTLVYFEGQVQNNHFVFNWETQSEINNDYFTIEFSSNGNEFTEIANIKGGGTQYTKTDYEYQYLPTVATSRGYFRLKQTDFDGTTEIFSPIYLAIKQTNNSGDVTVYPNPIKNNDLHIEFNNVEKGDYNLRLFSINNQLIVEKNISIDEFTKQAKFNLSDKKALSKGVYFLHIQGKNETYTKKIIAQ